MRNRSIRLLMCIIGVIVALAWAGCSRQAGDGRAELKYVVAAIHLVGDQVLDGSLAVYPGKRVKGEIPVHSLIIQPEKSARGETIVTFSQQTYSGLAVKRVIAKRVVATVSFKGASVEVKPQSLVLSADPEADAILSRVIVAALSEGAGPRATCGPIDISIRKTAKHEYFVLVSRIPYAPGAHWSADVVSKEGRVEVLRIMPGM